MSKKIVIIGSGFGGVYTYLNLKPFIQVEDLEVTIISKNNYFLFTPLLHEVATGGLGPQNVLQPVRDIIDNNVNFIEDFVREIDFNSQTVSLSEPKKYLSFDYIVIATGAETNFYNTNIVNSKVYELKDLRDACNIRNNIIESFEDALKEHDIQKRKKLLTFAVIGGGATGVELITEIHDYIFNTLYSKYSLSIDKSEIQLYLVNKSEKILERFDEKISSYAFYLLKNLSNLTLLNSYETNEITDNIIHMRHFGEDKSLPSANIYWVAGVKPVLPKFKDGVEFLPSGRVNITEFLNIKNRQEVFVLGDCAGSYPMLAQVAVRQAKVVANNIIFLIKKERLISFDYDIKAKLVSLGHKNAVANVYGLFFHGFIAWFLWRTIYLFNFIYWNKRVKIAVDWTVGLFSSRDMSKL